MDGTYPEAYFCIDQKSFYASVECVERQLDPMTALLVVADSKSNTFNIRSNSFMQRSNTFYFPKIKF